MRKVCYHLPERQIAELHRLAQASGFKIADLIRRAIDAFLDDVKRKGLWQ